MIEKVIPAALAKFLASPQCQDLIDDGLLGVDADDVPWVFQGSDDDRPFRDPKGSGRGAIVLTSNQSWGANPHNTAYFPLLTALVYMDVSRKADGTVLAKDGKLRTLGVINRVREVFHDPGNSDHDWPLDLYVYACVAQNGYSILGIPGSDNMHRGSINFEVSI